MQLLLKDLIKDALGFYYEGEVRKERKREERMKNAQRLAGIKPWASLSRVECSNAVCQPPLLSINCDHCLTANNMYSNKIMPDPDVSAWDIYGLKTFPF